MRGVFMRMWMESAAISLISEVRHIHFPSGRNQYHVTQTIISWSHYALTEGCCTFMDVDKCGCRLMRWCREKVITQPVELIDDAGCFGGCQEGLEGPFIMKFGKKFPILRTTISPYSRSFAAFLCVTSL